MCKKGRKTLQSKVSQRYTLSVSRCVMLKECVLGARAKLFFYGQRNDGSTFGIHYRDSKRHWG